MSDIKRIDPEYLRGLSDYADKQMSEALGDAADEIERLRMEWAAAASAGYAGTLQKEIKQLQEQNKYLLDVANSIAPRIKETEARLAEAEAQLAEADEIIRGWLKDWIERH